MKRLMWPLLGALVVAPAFTGCQTKSENQSSQAEEKSGKVEVARGEISRQESTSGTATEEWRRAKKEPVGSQLKDAWIHGKIVAKLIASSKVQERTIDVDVVNSNVTLRGKVQNAAQKREAERVAKDTGGVNRVNNQIEVS